jgi:hypothetical protein
MAVFGVHNVVELHIIATRHCRVPSRPGGRAQSHSALSPPPPLPHCWHPAGPPQPSHANQCKQCVTVDTSPNFVAWEGDFITVLYTGDISQYLPFLESATGAPPSSRQEEGASLAAATWQGLLALCGSVLKGLPV